MSKKFNFIILLGCIVLISCAKKKQQTNVTSGNEIIRYAKGLSIIPYDKYTKVTLSNPWPGATEQYTYILHEESFEFPDSLKSYVSIQVPIQTIVATSTTHIPPLEMLGVEESLVGFPNTNYVSSEATRKRIDAGKVREVGNNLSLNREVLIDMQPDLIMGFGVDGEKKAYEDLKNSGLNIMYNGDWTEQHPLGKAEWILLFGALYGKESLASETFSKIESEFNDAKKLVESIHMKPTIMSGSIYQDQWYLPHGNSWAAQFLNEAGGEYLWKNNHGEGSLALSFETVLEKAQHADFWIGPGQFNSYEQMLKSNPNYVHFKSFQEKKIYTFSNKKGSTGGVIYFELASSRPDWVLKDLIKILHPELMLEHTLVFFEPLQ
ncbi:MAG: ABC transporter substrate-binding protein [Flavobacterium sp.]